MTVVWSGPGALTLSCNLIGSIKLIQWWEEVTVLMARRCHFQIRITKSNTLLRSNRKLSQKVFFSSNIWFNWYNFSPVHSTQKPALRAKFLHDQWRTEFIRARRPGRLRSLSSQKLSRFGFWEIIIKITRIRFLAEPSVYKGVLIFIWILVLWNWNCLKHRMSVTSVTPDHGYVGTGRL